jgi:hypothetical protein
MSNQASRFVVDGWQRFLRSSEFRAKRTAIETQVRAEHEADFAAASDYWSRRAVEERVDREIERRLSSIMPSPYSLWSRQRSPG